MLGTPHVTSCGLFHQARSVPARQFPSRTPSFERGRSSCVDAGEEQHSIAMIERHTKAAHDGVIDMLTAKASKLGASLERTIVAKKDAEERTHKLQVLCGTGRRNTLFASEAGQSLDRVHELVPQVERPTPLVSLVSACTNVQLNCSVLTRMSCFGCCSVVVSEPSSLR